MTTSLAAALSALDAFCQPHTGQQHTKPAALTFHRGVEREGLRVNRSTGRIAHTPHPVALGSALTHESITTDYSEALLEFITGVHPSVEGVIQQLTDIHHFVNHTLAEQDECLWPASMPCYLENHADVPIANYGQSNTGKLKRVYREGLSNRYGRIMQCIAGMHYNFSFDADFWRFLQDFKEQQGQPTASQQDFQSDSYFALIRNFRRNSWLLSYLFGASPALDTSFLPKGTDRLDTLGTHTYVGHSATSLRMSDLGYQNNAQADLFVCYNEVSTYIKTLKTALKTPYPHYQSIGVKVDGEYRQLNSNILQIENEYYSDIRPKRVTQAGEHPSAALQERGVEYIEVRIMDLDPFSPIGMQANTLYFIDVFLVYCMLRGDEPLLEEECHALRELQQDIATHGRDPQHRFDFGQGDTSLATQGHGLLIELYEVAQFLTKHTGNELYQNAVSEQIANFADLDKLPASQVLALTAEKQGYTQAMLELAQRQQQIWLSQPLNEALLTDFSAQASRSFAQQAHIEASDNVDFDRYLADYLRPQ